MTLRQSWFLMNSISSRGTVVPRNRMKRWIILSAMTYLCLYVLISRVSAYRMKQYGGPDSFYYVPCDLTTLSNSKTLQTLHTIGIYLFYPVWAIDNMLGGPTFGAIPLDVLRDRQKRGTRNEKSMNLVPKVEPGPFGRNSHLSKRMEILLLVLLFSMLLPAVAGGFRFPSTRASQSPDGKWKLVCESPKNGDENGTHRLILTRPGKTASTELRRFDRGCDVLWSPDSSHVALTDWLGSNISDVFIYAVTNPVTSISLQELFPNGTIPETEIRGHCYFEATRWLDHNRLSLRIFGHTDEVKSHGFEYSYIFHVSTRDFEKAKGSGQKTPTRETPNHRQTSTQTLVFDPAFRMTSPILLSVQSPP
jgi:hypothetical protein